jgi:hypothetical protein
MKLAILLRCNNILKFKIILKIKYKNISQKHFKVGEKIGK